MEDTRAVAVIPLGSPIGSNRRILTKPLVEMLLENNKVVDAGIGKPSDAALAIEMRCDVVLANKAIATAQYPIKIAGAFSF